LSGKLRSGPWFLLLLIEDLKSTLHNAIEDSTPNHKGGTGVGRQEVLDRFAGSQSQVMMDGAKSAVAQVGKFCYDELRPWTDDEIDNVAGLFSALSASFDPVDDLA
jgi:hypothetical protein